MIDGGFAQIKLRDPKEAINLFTYINVIEILRDGIGAEYSVSYREYGFNFPEGKFINVVLNAAQTEYSEDPRGETGYSTEIKKALINVLNSNSPGQFDGRFRTLRSLLPSEGGGRLTDVPVPNKTPLRSGLLNSDNQTAITTYVNEVFASLAAVRASVGGVPLVRSRSPSPARGASGARAASTGAEGGIELTRPPSRGRSLEVTASARRRTPSPPAASRSGSALALARPAAAPGSAIAIASQGRAPPLELVLQRRNFLPPSRFQSSEVGAAATRNSNETRNLPDASAAPRPADSLIGNFFRGATSLVGSAVGAGVGAVGAVSSFVSSGGSGGGASSTSALEGAITQCFEEGKDIREFMNCDAQTLQVLRKVLRQYETRWSQKQSSPDTCEEVVLFCLLCIEIKNMSGRSPVDQMEAYARALLKVGRFARENITSLATAADEEGAIYEDSALKARHDRVRDLTAAPMRPFFEFRLGGGER
jgi:hypothetical protein